MQRRVNRALRQRLHQYTFPPNYLFLKPTQLASISSATTSRQTESRVSPSSYEKEPNKSCRVYNIKDRLVPYEEAWLCQQRLLQERIAWQRENSTSLLGRDVLLLLEHPPVYTLGRGSTLDNLKFDPGDPACKHEVRRTERGGEVTWHGPGQIVGYPVLDLNYHKKDLHWYLRQLEEVIIRVLARYDLQGERESDHTGVWVGGAKVAAIGLNATRWITSHGFALNVCPNLEAFKEIVPCGIQGRPVTRLCDLTSSLGFFEGDSSSSSSSRAMRVVRSQVVEEFSHVFGVQVEVEDIEANTGGLENALFPKECEPTLLERLRGDGRRQLELTRKRG